ncbi:zinc finger CCCH domain-containing protein 14 [Carex littledalei]|uniref:Zinc finger CCCH domain-containing protein 14 n=1 Tax=Carex littledalei TaxID=544730 RepID=A0A833RPA9_9POAL|nr:zinc finger CCCH domain-containing protein 14 [Carex littledalei]
MVGVREESDKINELFKSDPVTYRVDRRSALKMKLRRALSEKLTVFLSSFADETLVEYVIVLLCNGKDQYQARKDLVDFLEDSTESFVAWLWDFLSRKIDAVEKSGHTTSSCKRTEVQRPSNELRAHAGNASLVRPQDNEGPAEQSKYFAGSRETSNNLVLRSRNLQEEICGGVTHERSLALEEDLHERVTPRRSLRKKKIEEDPPISKPRGISSLGFVGGPYSPCLENGWHYKKGEKAHDSTRPSTSFQRPRSEVVAIGRKSKSSNKEVLRTKHSKKLPKLAMDKELKPVQRNVWDRLGKPQNETNNPFRERNNSLLVPTASVPPIDPLITQNLPSALPLHPHAQDHFVSTSFYPEQVVKTSSICTPMRANGVIVNKLKRQFEQIESHLLASAVTSKSRERVPAKQRLGISVGAPQLLSVGNCFSSNMVKEEPALVEIGFKPEIVCNAESVNSEQRPPITPTKEKALENSESGNSSEEPPSKVAHMKVKLEEMENYMQELCTKHANLENLKPYSETNPSSGTLWGYEGSNSVPFCEMWRCDESSLAERYNYWQTKGVKIAFFFATVEQAACVVFTKKDSVEKAISLSGTSLFSRTLKVMRKGDAPAGLLEQPHSLQLSPPSWNSLHRYPMTTHLQWRRETYPSVSK